MTKGIVMFKVMALTGLAFLALGGCGELFGDVVKLPRAAATSMIYNMPANANLMAMAGRFPEAEMRIATTEEGVVWTYRLSGQDACKFTAHVKEQDENTSVVWTSTEDVSAEGEGYLCAAVRVVGKESVAATIEGRPADRIKVETELAGVMVDNMGSVHKTLGKQVEAAAAQMEPQDCHKLGTSALQEQCRSGR